MTQLNLALLQNAEQLLQHRFQEGGLKPLSIERRAYPEETIFIVRVSSDDYLQAGVIGNTLDRELLEMGFKGFVTVRKAEDLQSDVTPLVNGVADSKVTQLTNLIAARSRTSEIQPSLEYIPDTAKNIDLVLAPRHQLIFGRRGAGKTALMVEAKRRIGEKGEVFAWINLHTLRSESAQSAFKFVCLRMCDSIQSFHAAKGTSPSVLGTIGVLRNELESIRNPSIENISEYVPRMQLALRRFLDSSPVRFYIFIDELHYLARKEQPQLLDMLHGCVRDCDAWLKVAGIRHLSRWFQTHPPIGLQTGHDADHIDLDLTLENPTKAKAFLETILLSYAKKVGIPRVSGLFSNSAVDRLVLASGAVPRDFLVLSAGAIRQAQLREKAKIVGVQDVNKSAGEAAKVKLTELEDDAASTGGDSIVKALNRLRAFCLDEKKYTYFRIDFRDKEKKSIEYGFVQDLMDLRLLHLIDSSLSDQHQAGRRSEVYMLDLSQFSGQRLKKQLKVLDFEGGHIVLKVTGTNIATKVGTTPRQRLGLLRRGPLFDLKDLNEV